MNYLWIAPLVITFASFGYAIVMPDGGDGFTQGLMTMFRLISALVLSLFVWLVWAIVT